MAGKQKKQIEGKPQYTLQSALAECMSFYNNRIHGTIRCTPEEAFQHKHFSTEWLLGMPADEIRVNIVNFTKSKGMREN